MAIYDSTKLDKDDTIRLNLIADEIKDYFIASLDQYYDKYGVDPFWWLTSLASHNVNYDASFFKICLLILIDEKICSGKYDKIITDSKAMKKTLVGLIKSKGLKIEVDLTSRADETVRDRIVTIVSRLAYSAFSKFKIEFVESSLNSHKPDKIDILVWGPLLINKINGQEYEDGYFPKLDELCSKKFYYYPYLIYNTDEKWKKIIKKVNGVSTYDFIHMRSSYRWYDSFFCLRYRWYCLKLRRKEYLFDKYDISSIVSESIETDLRRTDFLYAVKYYLATKRLLNKIPVGRIVLWYEARPVDIAITLAARDSKNNTEIIGYIGYAIPENYLGKSPTMRQVENSVVPEVITVPGAMYGELIKRFAPRQKTIIVPSMRVNSLRTRGSKHGEINTIFVALSYFPTVSCDMIKIVNNYCRTSQRKDLHVVVKMHPTFAGRECSDFYAEKLYFEPEYTNENISECLKRADVAFASATSSTMDTIMSGTYLICLCKTGQLYFTCIAPGISEDKYSIIFDEKDFKNAMKKASNYNKNEGKNKVSSNDYFAPFTKESVEPLFE